MTRSEHVEQRTDHAGLRPGTPAGPSPEGQRQSERLVTRLAPSEEVTSTPAIDRAINRVLAEIHDGLRHGFFEFSLTCEVIGQERRRLTLHAGKSYQFVIPKEDCVRPAVRTHNSCDGSDPHAA